MAYYSKRRARPGPSKNELKVHRGMETANQTRLLGHLSERYPFVERLSIQMDFLTPEEHLFDQKSWEFEPSDACDFTVSCPGRCSSGSFDVAANVQLVIEAKETFSESIKICQQSLYADSSSVCGFRFRCKIQVTYFSKQT